jgi:hypothetical protein
MATKTKVKKALLKVKKTVLLKKKPVKKAASASQNGPNGKKPAFVPTKLKLVKPVPSDIEIHPSR